jgi:hypothetical protein
MNCTVKKKDRRLSLPTYIAVGLVLSVIAGQSAYGKAVPSASAVEIFQEIDRAGLQGPVVRLKPEQMNQSEVEWVKNEVRSTLRAMAQSCKTGDLETFSYHIGVAEFSGFFPALFQRMRSRVMGKQELMAYLCDIEDGGYLPTQTRVGQCESRGCTDVQFRGRNLIPTMSEDGFVRFVGLGQCALDVCHWPVATTRHAFRNRHNRAKRLASKF